MAMHALGFQGRHTNWAIEPAFSSGKAESSKDLVRIVKNTKGNGNFASFPFKILLQRGSRLSSCRLHVLCSSSGAQFRRKSRTKRPTKSSESDGNFLRELQQFILSEGLPPGQVPSTKQLANRGRDDLANTVRRRGYKAVTQLLANTDIATSSSSDGEKSTKLSTEVPCAGGGSENQGSSLESPMEVSSAGDGSTNQRPSLESPLLLQLSLNGSARPGSLENCGDISENLDVRVNGLVVDQPLNDGNSFGRDVPSFKLRADKEPSKGTLYFTALNDTLSKESAVEQSLRERAADFVRTGHLDFGENAVEDEEEEELTDDYDEDSSDDEDGKDLLELQHANNVNAESLAYKKAAMLHSKLLPHIRDIAPIQDKEMRSDDLLFSIMAKQQEIERIFHRDMELQSAFGIETQKELDHIKSALCSRELELAEVARELEEARAQLALVRAKATAELAQAKQAALEKDVRLKAANQALSNLKQVQIEYWGEGGRVEIAGSFNGWQHLIVMEPDPTSEILNLDSSRREKGPMMWGTELWLYPGDFEIKFIVDGNWQLDPRREVVMRGMHQNNILRVEP